MTDYMNTFSFLKEHNILPSQVGMGGLFSISFTEPLRETQK